MATDPDLKGIKAKLELKLGALNTRLINESEAVDLSGATANAIIDALAQIPGALAVAADLVSGALFQGLGDTFDANADAVDGGGNGWEYSAVMDGATCEECAGRDGEHYDTWEEIAGSDGPLPDGGPNPDCDGEDRCRCRAAIA